MNKEVKIEEHLQWWSKNIEKGSRDQEFTKWLETSDEGSRKFLYNFVENNSITEVLEGGPGIFLDYFKFFSQKPQISYTVVDITPSIVQKGVELGVKCAHQSLEDLQFKDNAFELTYCRHVFEHLDHYTHALEEMIRVSRKFVVVIFWLLETESEEDTIKFDSSEKLYHNRYSQKKLEHYLNLKQLKYFWEFTEEDKILVIEK